MDDGAFCWDDAKAEANFHKHAVRFEQARAVFTDAFALEYIDDREDYGEERCIMIGMAHSRLLYVAYTMRAETIRLISARLAEPFERRAYHDFNSW
jgi:uncharacterized protein